MPYLRLNFVDAVLADRLRDAERYRKVSVLREAAAQGRAHLAEARSSNAASADPRVTWDLLSASGWL